MSARPDLDQLPAGTELLLKLRYMPDSVFDEFTDDELGNAIKWLYRARYSTLQGAVKLQRILAARDSKGVAACSSSNPSSTETGL